MNEQYFEVDFKKYCDTCEYEDLIGTKEPCNECLAHPMNVQSHKPLCWKVKDGSSVEPSISEADIKYAKAIENVFDIQEDDND